jgi:hypothetical protein
LNDPAWPRGVRDVLIEKQLDTKKFKWQKWNDNFGGVDGKRGVHLPMDVDFELEQMKLGNVAVIEEGSEEEEEEEDDNDDDESSKEEMFEHGTLEEVDQDGHLREHSDEFAPSDFLQAFSHFTYLFTNRRLLVCDLQGVYNTDATPPMFELSDPAIHYRTSSSSRKSVFGRTDIGQAGVQSFLNSHKCTAICKFMELSRKNKKWRKGWHRNFSEDMKNNFLSF